MSIANIYHSEDCPLKSLFFAVTDNPMINEGLFQGDIMGIDPNTDRNAIALDSQRWNGGVIPYVISPELSSLTESIQKVMDHIQVHTCLRFVQRTHEHDYVDIFKDNGCYSYVGRIGRGGQKLSLGPGCESFGVILHELLHAVGFHHEHMRSDRDDYIIINWENIDQKWYYAFEKLRPEQNRLLTEFDYGSIMLYGSNSFAKVWGQHSMTGKDGRLLKENWEKYSLSTLDAKRIKMLYECP
ncbi:astacin-like metalloprotease toxin 5 [Parasteatoda tepidariorum]|uniref:astacin-like metalloprotease toxin 5 n=1 Tax=Parasteatoda tepidariorum TaxID=114398 RepID=UPI001C71AE5E|nr:astacin-like metalloprotease toxin 5 [Parasteatoda tepidariorum]